MRDNIKKYVSVILIFAITFLAACGKDDEEAYSSPNFSSKQEEEIDEELSTPLDASITDALMVASYTDATSTDATPSDAALNKPASLTDATPMGMYDGNTYYNALAEFKMTVDGAEWKFYDAAGVASATNADLEYVNNLWAGFKSPYDEGTTYAAIAYDTKDGSNAIISYINPDKYLMPEFNAEAYLKMSSEKYTNYSLGKVTFLGQKYYCLDVKDDMETIGRRTQFAIDKEGLIVLITFTMHEGALLEEAVRLLSPIDY